MNGFPRPLPHPFLQLLLLLGLLFAGLCVGYFLAVAVATLGLGFSFSSLQNLGTQPAATPHGWGGLMVLQGFSLAGLGAGAAALPLVLRQSWAGYFAPRRLGAGWWLLAAAALVVVVLPFLSALIAWNAGAHFPAYLHDFEVWARLKEDQAAELTRFLTQFTTVGRLLLALLVVAVVPAVAEELVFRGVIQQSLVRWFGSRHVGVWLAAAIFSAIHFQFFGFVPRFVLGLVLGYLYEWSGNILVPMAAHFTQNAVQLLILYAAQHGQLPGSFDPDSTTALPWPLVLLSGLLTAALLWFLRGQMRPAPLAENPLV